MATRFLTRSLLTSPRPAFDSLLTRSFTALAVKTPQPLSVSSTPSLLRLRPLVAVATTFRSSSLSAGSVRAFSTRQTTSSLNDPNPNWANRPPKETILLDGCDFEHWLVVVEKPDESWTRDQIIDSYIKTLAQVVGSEEEARKNIYSVSTRHYFAFGALVSEELSFKLKELPGVRWVLPDSYLDVKNKDYGGEPFINGQAVPYDPKYHEEWVRNNARANERNRRNNRPRDNDRSRNFDRRRGPPMQGSSYQGPPPQNMGPNPGGYAPPPNAPHGNVPNHGGAPYQPAPGPNNNSAPPPPNMGSMPNSPPNAQHSYAPYQPGMGQNQNQHSYAPNMSGGVPHNAPNPQYGNAPSPQYGNAPSPQYGNAPSPQYGNTPSPQYGNAPSPQYGNAPSPQYGNAPPPPHGGGGHHQSGPGPNAPNMYPNQNQNIPGRD